MKNRRFITKISETGGMTMVEVTFASVVLLGAIMIMISMFNMAIGILSFTTTRSIATQIANEEVENARSMDYEQVLNTAPAQWPNDSSLDKSVLPPKYRDIDDTSSQVLRTIATTTTAGHLSVERNVIRKHSSFTIRSYVLWVGDATVTQAYKRMVVKITWPSPGTPGEVVMATNFAKSDAREPRPSVSIAGVRSTNFNYFKGYVAGVDVGSEDATMGQDDSIRGPGTVGTVTLRTPTVYVKASHNSAKATGINRVDFTLLSPSGAVLTTGSDNTKDANGYYSWDLGTTSPVRADDTGYVIKAEAFDSLARSEVTTMRINIDNTQPLEPQDTVADNVAARRVRVSWTEAFAPGEAVPLISRYIIERRPKDGTYSQRAAVPGTVNEYYDAGVNGVYSYRVTAVDTAGNLSTRSDKDRSDPGVTTDTVAPDAVTASTAGPASWKAIDLYWSPASDNTTGTGVAGYLWYSSDNLINWTIVGETRNIVGDPLYYQDTGLKPGKTFYYRPYTVDAVGNMSTLGPQVSAATPMR